MSRTPLYDLVDPLVGSQSHHGFSVGNCLPLCALPFGMAHWCPESSEGSWLFDSRRRKLRGIRLTHQPSPWIGDYGAFRIMAVTGEWSNSTEARASAYRLDLSTVRPHALAFDLIRYRTRIELAPSLRGAVVRFTFPDGEVGRVIVERVGGESGFSIDARGYEAWTNGSSGGCPADFASHLVGEFSVAPLSGFEIEGGYVFEFDDSLVELQLGSSFISADQARLNAPEGTLEEVASEAHEEWRTIFDRLDVDSDDETARGVFATCLYRCHLFPRTFHEIDAEGRMVHYSPFAGGVHAGPMYTDNGFWDTYRTLYPFFALAHPTRLAEMLQGFVNASDEGGWAPQWMSPGYRGCMVGSHSDAVFADALARGVDGFDVQGAFRSALRHADEEPDPASGCGRIGGEDFARLGFVPSDRHHEAVSRTLDYAYDDWCIARMAERLGRAEDVARFDRRAANYRSMWDPGVGFMRGRNEDGSWVDFHEFRWGGDYVEGGAWQTSWNVPHDLDGLADLLGGKEALVAKLEAMLASPPWFESGSYGFEIHEMTEMACADFGQYAHSNQPVHAYLYLFALLGRPDLTRHWTRRVMDELYTPTAFPGDEDNGEMSAWCVLSALGLYPSCPGRGDWTLGAPRFDRVTLKLESGADLVIERGDAATWNGEPIEGPTIEHAKIVQGGRLVFKVDREP